MPSSARAALRILRQDPAMAQLIEHVGPYRLTVRPLENPFGALVHSIAHQQLTGKAAQTILGRVCALFPDPDQLDAAHLRRLTDAKLRGAGLSFAKIRAIRDLADKCLDGTVPPATELARLEDDAVVERLTAVRGVGRWTAEMLLIFRLGRKDVLPVDDYGVRKGFARAFRRRQLPTPKQLARWGERWRPHRTAASWYLWRATELPPETWARR